MPVFLRQGFYKLFMTHRFVASPIGRLSERSCAPMNQKIRNVLKKIRPFRRETILLRATCYVSHVKGTRRKLSLTPILTDNQNKRS